MESEQDPYALTEVLANKWFRPGKPHLEKRLEATKMYVPEQEEKQVNTGLNELLGGFGYLKDMFNFGKP
jgi:hypothetical protein